MTSLRGKTALATGSSKSIGRAIALEFGERKANVVATARTASEIEDEANSVRGFGGRALAVGTGLYDRANLAELTWPRRSDRARSNMRMRTLAWHVWSLCSRQFSGKCGLGTPGD